MVVLISVIPSAINFILYGTALLFLIYVSYALPTWRGELFAATIALSIRVLFYATSILGRADLIHVHGDLLHFLSVMSSMFTGVIMVGYGGWFVSRLRGGGG